MNKYYPAADCCALFGMAMRDSFSNPSQASATTPNNVDARRTFLHGIYLLVTYLDQRRLLIETLK